MKKDIILETKNLCFAYQGADKHLLENISFSVKENEFIAILWPSWVGKSTLLDLIAWLRTPNSWEIIFRGKSVSDNQDALDLHTRHNVWIIFQNYWLFPWLTVEKHILFWLLNTNNTKAQKKLLVENVLEKIWLSHVKNSYPHELSWWMQQRLAVGSILANDSPCLLMDEPFSAIDIVTRHNMQKFLLEIQKKFNKTVIFITHQIDEALLLADRILLLWWKPTDFIHEITIKESHPRDLHTTRFMNLRKEIHNWLMF